MRRRSAGGCDARAWCNSPVLFSGISASGCSDAAGAFGPTFTRADDGLPVFDEVALEQLEEGLAFRRADDGEFVRFGEGDRVAIPFVYLVEAEGVHALEQLRVGGDPLWDFDAGDFISCMEVEKVDAVGFGVALEDTRGGLEGGGAGAGSEDAREEVGIGDALGAGAFRGATEGRGAVAVGAEAVAVSPRVGALEDAEGVDYVAACGSADVADEGDAMLLEAFEGSVEVFESLLSEGVRVVFEGPEDEAAVDQGDGRDAVGALCGGFGEGVALGKEAFDGEAAGRDGGGFAGSGVFGIVFGGVEGGHGAEGGGGFGPVAEGDVADVDQVAEGTVVAVGDDLGAVGGVDGVREDARGCGVDGVRGAVPSRDEP
ncbi:MAG: hypothetical protein NZ557_07240 [Chthonomonadaceae bacterium]|nr:hypothetical protein [Chthonomonadaceae bacterium]